MSQREQAPLFTKMYDLVLWLHGRTQAFPKAERFLLAKRIMNQAINAMEATTLALRGIEQEENIHRADTALCLLRLHLRLATDLHLLKQRQLHFALCRIEELGKMVGGWLKRF